VKNSAIVLVILAAGCALPEGSPNTDAGSELPAEDAFVYVHLRASHDAVPHAPATTGQTPRAWSSGIRSLHLLRTIDDAAPALVFSWARAVHTHVRFTIDATFHSTVALPGELEDLIVLSDRTLIDGALRSRGDYRYVFRTGTAEYPAEGSGFALAPIPGGGFTARVENGETAYYFPVFLEVSDELTEDVHMIFEVNVHEGFRWTEQPYPSFESGVFDTSLAGTEPIVQAGANGYAYFVE
jgi:hypothetical protein